MFTSRFLYDRSNCAPYFNLESILIALYLHIYLNIYRERERDDLGM